ncbi:MAG: Fatty acid metabolism regulator protein [Myxococcota bacterium]|nr:Fatty acid metabolism regulator protein [Myxococcota bacterium]
MDAFCFSGLAPAGGGWSIPVTNTDLFNRFYAAVVYRKRDAHITPQSQTVFEHILTGILRDQWKAGEHLPPERELAEQLNTNRGTLREALRKLEALRVIEARRGSGITVRDYRSEANMDILPYFLRAGAPGADMRVLVEEMIRTRRTLMREILRIAAQYSPPGALSGARQAFEEAWARRNDSTEYVLKDLEIFHRLTLASGVLPVVWMYNQVAHVYAEVLGMVAPVVMVTDEYRTAYMRVFEALEQRDGEAAFRYLTEYTDRVDQRLLRNLFGDTGDEPAIRGNGFGH